MTKELLKSLALRFVRAFVASGVSAMILVAPINASNWTQLGTWLSALALAGIVGGVTGALMTLDKWFRAS